MAIDFTEKAKRYQAIDQIIASGRKLKWIKTDKPSPRPLETLISIPYTPPGEVFSLSVQYDARGSEGPFKSEWIMVDSDDKNCFPNPFGSLDVYITVNNTLLDKFGGE